MLLYLFVQRPMINPCTTLSILGYVINITVTLMNGSQENYISNFISDTLGNSMGIFMFSYSELFNETLEPNSIYVLTVIPLNNSSKLFILCGYVLALLFVS